MTYLVDTHVLIWYANGNSRLSQKFIQEINSPQNQILISKASLWEMAIKISLNKLEIGIPFFEVNNYLIKKEIGLLDFDYADLIRMMELPHHHRDPFDRMIIAQAIVNGCTVITDDPKFQLYPVQLL